MITFFIGLAVGAVVGVFLMALCCANNSHERKKWWEE